jgi:hypothetical protein
MANFLFSPYRNSVVGKTSEYSTRVDCDTDTLFVLFNDNGTVAPVATDVFQSTFTTAENPSFANRLNLGSVTAGVVATGVVDAADSVFTGGSVLTGTTSVESLIISKFITNAAASPNLAYFDTATGLSGGLTPNGADVTVVWNASGIWKF